LSDFRGQTVSTPF